MKAYQQKRLDEAVRPPCGYQRGAWGSDGPCGSCDACEQAYLDIWEWRELVALVRDAVPLFQARIDALSGLDADVDAYEWLQHANRLLEVQDA